MSRYERTFDTDWESLDADEATERAYAIGVAERLGEDDRDHLERIYAEMDTAYERSVVELAYEEGRKEADAAAAAAETDETGDLWAELVARDSEAVPPDVATVLDGREGLPDALDSSEILDRLDLDSTEATDRPGFLDR